MPFWAGPVINENVLENTQKLGIVTATVQAQPEETIKQGVQQAPQQPTYQDVNVMMSNQMQQPQPQQVQQQVQQVQQAPQTTETNNQNIEML